MRDATELGIYFLNFGNPKNKRKCDDYESDDYDSRCSIFFSSLSAAGEIEKQTVSATA